MTQSKPVRSSIPDRFMMMVRMYFAESRVIRKALEIYRKTGASFQTLKEDTLVSNSEMSTAH